jgi:hypothetical protein
MTRQPRTIRNIYGKTVLYTKYMLSSARFFQTLSTQVHTGKAGAHAQGKFHPNVTRTGNAGQLLVSLLYKEKNTPSGSRADTNPL